MSTSGGLPLSGTYRCLTVQPQRLDGCCDERTLASLCLSPRNEVRIQDTVLHMGVGTQPLVDSTFESGSVTCTCTHRAHRHKKKAKLHRVYVVVCPLERVLMSAVAPRSTIWRNSERNGLVWICTISPNAARCIEA